MIVRMKEIVVFTSSMKIDNTISELGELGVVDIQKVKNSKSESITKNKNLISDTETVIHFLSTFDSKKSLQLNNNNVQINNPSFLVKRILKAKELQISCSQKIASLKNQLKFYEIWGENFQLDDVKLLKERGVYLQLYLTKKEDLKNVILDENMHVFPEIEQKLPIAYFTKNFNKTLDFEKVSFPLNSFQNIHKKLARKIRQQEKIAAFLIEKSQYQEFLKEYLFDLQNSLSISSATESMQTIAEKCEYLQGYLPKDEVKNFIPFAQKNNWGYAISEPENLENVPVYIKNPKWIEIINPIMKFIDIIPGYKEVDVSIYFLVAFALFFAMLVGDAGYGLIFLLAIIIFRKKIPKQMAILVVVLSISTIIWGVLSGTYFGSSTIAEHPFFNSFIIDNISTFGIDNITFMMHLSFLIGAIHLTIAHSVRGFQFINSIKSISQLGWIGLVWGLFFITEQLVLGKPMPNFASWLFVIGAILVILFSMESNTFLKSVRVSIANLPLSLISGFSDIVSYVRLFAVGMATAAVASSFNNMILSSGFENMGFLQIIAAIIALLLGHGLNIALAITAVMVHGIRLNMLEFSSHLGVEFSGNEYKPFKIMSSIQNKKQITIQ